MEKIKKKIDIIRENIPEILFSLGVFFIIFTTFLLNFIAGMYVSGLILILLGLFLARLPTNKK